uniref:Transcriptional adapter 2B n=1 Tax=Sipha flava TaxID=143950 RepID=A0A2S2Q518_9HEMI
MSSKTYDSSYSKTDMSKSEMKHFCTYCQDEISSVPCQSNTANNSMTIFIHCAICEDIFLCLMCFSSGAEIGNHKNNHDYKLVTFSKSNLYAVKLLSALEEWISEDTEKYLNTRRLVLSWKDVASFVGSENPEEVKKEYYQTYVDGPLGQNIIKLVNNYVGYRSIMTLDQALKMKCFESCPTYFPTSKFIRFPEDKEKEDGYMIYEESYNEFEKYEDMKFYEETLDSYQLQLLIQCTSEFGYGNWDAISKLYNSIIHEEYHKEKWNYLSEQRVKEEYTLRFIQNPLLCGTWLPLEHTRPLIPDRTNRIQGPKNGFEDYLKKQLPIDDLDIFFYPPPLNNYRTDKDEFHSSCEYSNNKPEKLSELNPSECVYCQEEFAVIGYRIDNHKFSNYKTITKYSCCTNKQTCENMYLCLSCLGSGAEIGRHKRYHNYKLITEVKLYSSQNYFHETDWTAMEELAFLYALEEWTCKETEKYIDPINSENLINDWNNVSQHVGSRNANEAEIEFEHFISNQRIWKLVALYTGTEPLITYEEAVEMGCFENHNNYFSALNRSQKNIWNKSDLKLLFDCMTIYGYGNWQTITIEFNKIMADKYFGNQCVIRTPEEIKHECLLRFYDRPIRQRKWKPPSNSRPIIFDRTHYFKEPVNLKYPVMNSNLFIQIGYDYVNDEFEYPYMDHAESLLDLMGDFEIKPKLPSEDKFKMKLKDQFNIEPYLNIEEEKTIISCKQYNEVLNQRRIAKACVHSYRLIEQFAIYKDKQLPKIKPFSVQSFGERLVKMSRFMTLDIHRSLIEGAKNEKLLAHRLKELQFYKIIGLKKLNEIDVFNKLHQKVNTVKN